MAASHPTTAADLLTKHDALSAAFAQRLTQLRPRTASRFAGLSGLVCMPQPQSKNQPVGHTALGLRVRRIAIPSGDIAFIDEGDGPPVLLLHGAPVTSLGFVRVIRSLRARHRVIAPDLPGFGQSRAATRFGGSLPEYAKSIEEFVDALELPSFVLFGCDAGACMGLAAAAKIPSRIAGLVIADTVPLPLMGRAWLVKMILRHIVSSRFVRFLNRRFNLVPWLVATLDPRRRPFSAHERAVLTSQYDSREKRDRILDVFFAMGRDDEFMRETGAAVAACLANKPALLLFGQFDPVRFVGAISRFREMFPRSTVAIIRKEKHFPILAAGEEVATAMKNWMSTIEGRDDPSRVPDRQPRHAAAGCPVS
jgi:haloalkane dehalogenase